MHNFVSYIMLFSETIQNETGWLRGALIAGMVHFIDETKKVTRPNHMENLVAELLARNVKLGIDSHICAPKVSPKVDEQLWLTEKNPGVSETH
jgi:hypothetical protein